MTNEYPTVPIASNGLEGWSSCHSAAVTISIALGDPVLCCKECYEEVVPVPLEGEAGVRLGEIVAAVIDGTMTPDEGVEQQRELLGSACENCGKVWPIGTDEAEQWGVYHGRVHEPWLCPSCLDDDAICARLGDAS